MPQTGLRIRSVGHHVLPPFPLYAHYRGERPAALTKLPLDAAHVLSGVEVRHERCGVVHYVLGLPRSGTGILSWFRSRSRAGQISGSWRGASAGRYGLGTAGIRTRGDDVPPMGWSSVNAGGAGGKCRPCRDRRPSSFPSSSSVLDCGDGRVCTYLRKRPHDGLLVVAVIATYPLKTCSSSAVLRGCSRDDEGDDGWPMVESLGPLLFLVVAPCVISAAATITGPEALHLRTIFWF